MGKFEALILCIIGTETRAVSLSLFMNVAVLKSVRGDGFANSALRDLHFPFTLLHFSADCNNPMSYFASANSGGRVGRPSHLVWPTHNAYVCLTAALSRNSA